MPTLDRVSTRLERVRAHHDKFEESFMSVESSDASFDLAVVDRLLKTTVAVRRRLDLTRPVDRQLLVECLQLACYAPSRSNSQAYRWVVVDDPDLRRQAGEMYRDCLEARLVAQIEKEVPADEGMARLTGA